MNKHATVRMYCYSLRSALFFSLVQAPSLCLFVLFLILSFNNSIAGRFLDVARTLVDGAPEGKINVSVCRPSLPVFLEPQSPDLVVSQSEPAYQPVMCEKQIISVEDERWQKETDSLIRSGYYSAALIGFIVWLFTHQMSEINLINFIYRGGEKIQSFISKIRR